MLADEIIDHDTEPLFGSSAPATSFVCEGEKDSGIVKPRRVMNGIKKLK
jgi:hypothetical protein